MPESRELHKEIVQIKRDIRDIKATQELDILLNKEKYMEYVNEAIGNSKERALVFLAVDGVRLLQEISKEVGMRPQNVSRAKKVLENKGLIHKLPARGIYGKPRWVKILHIENFIRRKFGIDTL